MGRGGAVKTNTRPSGCANLASFDAQMEFVDQSGFRAFQIGERQAANDPAGAFISDAQDDGTTPLVRQRGAVFHELLKVKVGFRLLELEMLVFLCAK